MWDAFERVMGGFFARKHAQDFVKWLYKNFTLEGKELAEAQLGSGLGYKLCKAHYPPSKMLLDRHDSVDATAIHKCPKCSAEDPPPEHFMRRERLNAKSIGRIQQRQGTVA